MTYEKRVNPKNLSYIEFARQEKKTEASQMLQSLMGTKLDFESMKASFEHIKDYKIQLHKPGTYKSLYAKLAEISSAPREPYNVLTLYLGETEVTQRENIHYNLMKRYKCQLITALNRHGSIAENEVKNAEQGEYDVDLISSRNHDLVVDVILKRRECDLPATQRYIRRKRDENMRMMSEIVALRNKVIRLNGIRSFEEFSEFRLQESQAYTENVTMILSKIEHKQAAPLSGHETGCTLKQVLAAAAETLNILDKTNILQETFENAGDAALLSFRQFRGVYDHIETLKTRLARIPTARTILPVGVFADVDGPNIDVLVGSGTVVDSLTEFINLCRDFVEHIYIEKSKDISILITLFVGISIGKYLDGDFGYPIPMLLGFLILRIFAYGHEAMKDGIEVFREDCRGYSCSCCERTCNRFFRQVLRHFREGRIRNAPPPARGADRIGDAINTGVRAVVDKLSDWCTIS